MGKELNLDSKMQELRELLREANGTLKDIRQERKLVVELIATNLREVINTVVMFQATEAMEDYRSELEKAINDARDAVYERFQFIAAMCLGENWEGDKENDSGLKPLEELVRRYLAQNGGPPVMAKPEGVDRHGHDH